MRDLDRLKEVREYRVTGPQLAALLSLGVLVVVASFVAGFEAGLWRRPIDEDLMRPAGSDGDRDAGEVLAALLAERSEEIEDDGGPPRMKAPSLVTSIENPDANAAQQGSGVDEEASQASPEEAGGESPDGAGLTVADDTRGPEPEAADVASALPAVALEERLTPEPEEPVQAPTPASEPSPEPKSAPPVPATAVEESTKPQEVATDASLPASPPGRTGFTVQLAAYPSSMEAGELIGDLRSKGFEAFHQEASVDGKTWYRVRVGVYSSREDAESEARRLSKVSPFTPYVTTQP